MFRPIITLIRRLLRHMPFNKPFYLIINVAVGGYFEGFEVDNEIFPQEFLIDYIKVFKDPNL